MAKEELCCPQVVKHLALSYAKEFSIYFMDFKVERGISWVLGEKENRMVWC